MSLALAGGAWLASTYRRTDHSKPSGENDALWLRRFRLSLLATGIVWGMASLMLFTPKDIQHQAFLAFTMAGLTAGTMVSLSADVRSALLYVSPALVPLFIRLFLEGGRLDMAMGLLVSLFFVFLLAHAKRAQRSFQETVMLRRISHAQENTLHEQKNNLRSVLDNAPIGIRRQDGDGRLLFVNRSYCNWLGIPEEKFLAVERYAELYDQEMAKRWIASDMAAIAADTPQVSHEQFMFTDGKLHDLEITKIRLEDDRDLSGLIGIARDITQFRQAEQQLQASERAANQALAALEYQKYALDQHGSWPSPTSRAALLMPMTNFAPSAAIAVKDCWGMITTCSTQDTIPTASSRRCTVPFPAAKSGIRKSATAPRMDICIG